MPQARIIMGHGSETTQPFESRKQLPAGYTLVTLAECGVSTLSDQVAKIVDAFSNPDNKAIFEDPIHHQTELKTALQGLNTHIYTEGMRYPEMKIHMFAYWMKASEVNTTPTQIAISKSGIYDFPLERDEWRLQEANTTQKSMFGPVELASSKESYRPYLQFKGAREVARKSYGGSLFPTVEQVKTILASVNNNFEEFVETMVFPLERIFEECGSGVYYHFICRAPLDTGISEYMESFTENYELPPIPKEYSANEIMAVPHLLPAMQAAATKRQEQYNRNLADLLAKTGKTANQLTPAELYSLQRWNYANVVGAPEKFQRAHQTITNTRRKSIQQQEALLSNSSSERRRKTRRQKARKTRRRLRKFGGYTSHWNSLQDEIQFVKDFMDALDNHSMNMVTKRSRLESFYKSIPHFRFLIHHPRFMSTTYTKIGEFQQSLPVDSDIYQRAREFLAQHM